MFLTRVASSRFGFFLVDRTNLRRSGFQTSGLRRSRDLVASWDVLERRVNLSIVNLTGLWTGILTDPEVSESVWQETVSLTGSGGTYSGYRLSQVTDSSDFVEWSAAASLSGDHVQLTDQSIYDSYLGSSEYVPITATMTLSGGNMSGTWSGSYDGVTYTGTIHLSLQTGGSETSGAVSLSGIWVGTLTDPEDPNPVGKRRLT